MKYKNYKRKLDILISLIGLIFLMPLFIIVSIAIKVESKGPIIFKQKRLGENGRIFNIYKFRSMVVGAEKSGVYELEGDSRVTKVGKFIRKTSIDELPQFLNILKGDMSIIGPRPTLTYHPWTYEKYDDFQLQRFLVKPGVSGWAQVNGRKELSWEERIKFDVYYVENYSFLFDLKIIVLTLIKVLRMESNLNINETTNNKDVNRND
ncbi:putative sugar transferase EpsL [Jeotgalicoccus saudimassiliensis]|uniref:Putative sugar transferase EpsL n=1 Tax=Jeotgalicoccus saudimassiliensis TaxID=1461582 RepID=A0A078M711_9STAP|nr:sugar transferase [Jeotgalicoccus saudimassiliensis]CEA00491.1 putative sugar transferase EpsL [Jeotgalicoccus saudimassiliensis]